MLSNLFTTTTLPLNQIGAAYKFIQPTMSAQSILCKISLIPQLTVVRRFSLRNNLNAFSWTASQCGLQLMCIIRTRYFSFHLNTTLRPTMRTVREGWLFSLPLEKKTTVQLHLSQLKSRLLTDGRPVVDHRENWSQDVDETVAVGIRAATKTSSTEA